MDKKSGPFVVILCAILITILFHRQSLGLNLLIFELVILGWFAWTRQFRFRGQNPVTVGLGLLITAVATVFTHSGLSYVINFLVFFVFVGVLIYPETKSLIHTAGLSVTNMFVSQFRFLKEAMEPPPNERHLGNLLYRSRIFLVPALIIFLFVVIYRQSNPVFDELNRNAGIFLQEKLGFIFNDFDFLLILTFLISMPISVFIFIRTPDEKIIETDKNSVDILERQKKPAWKQFIMKALLNEHRAGIFLLVVLNLLLLVVNVIDIRWVWFGFEWEGQYLKQFVHEGTYLLILSIMISIGLVLYFFRGNLNFYRQNNLLKFLSVAWLAQNAILAISVAIRNFWYIHYFSLAYKRIGVLIFLILTLYGLYTVFVKVRNRKSTFYLFTSNAYALLVVLIVSSTINWDNLIARYNFKHASTSFLHLDFMASLSDKALPYLDKPLPELRKIEDVQKELFPFEQKYMTADQYHSLISRKKIKFAKKWESKGILSWNLPEHQAYSSLFPNDKK